MSEQLWFVYMILSSDQQIYTGITTNMTRRWREHSEGKAGARYFNGRKPEALCLLEAVSSRSNASKREYLLKSLSRPKKIDHIVQSLNSTRSLFASQQFADLPIIDAQSAPFARR